MAEKRKVIYYNDELNSEFSKAQIKTKEIGDDYVYIRESAFRRFTHFFWYRIVALPLARLYLKLAFRHRTENKAVLESSGGGGYFLFGNHTQDIADALIPAVTVFPRDAYVIVHPNNVSMPVLGRITPSLGALPLPDTLRAGRNFMKAIDRRIEEKKAVVIYPEAHNWPYYTDIRPFKDDSFYYPIKYGCPSYCFTNTYRKRRHGKKPRIVTYIDGPFYPDTGLKGAERRRDLRDRIYACMKERSRLSDTVYIRYIRKNTAAGSDTDCKAEAKCEKAEGTDKKSAG